MNCYHKILQKNVYRTCAGNCDEIASVVSLHRHDKFKIVMANEMTPSNSKLSSRTQCGDLLASVIFQGKGLSTIRNLFRITFPQKNALSVENSE